MKTILQSLSEDIRLRGLSNSTEIEYVKKVETFLNWANKPEGNVTEQEFRAFLQYLINERNIEKSTINAYNSAIRFFFGVTLDQIINYRQVPRLKQRRPLPDVLTKAEIAQLFDVCDNLRDRAILMLLYGSGLRLSEVAMLKVVHIDSKSMKVFVDNGKGGKDRYTILSDQALLTLREYWKLWRTKDWLFVNKLKDKHISVRTIQDMLKKYLKRTNITKHITIHTLRQSFATHLLEDGVSVVIIKKLLGHTHIQSTTFYLHVANMELDFKSPLDNLSKKHKKRSKRSKIEVGDTNA